MAGLTGAVPSGGRAAASVSGIGAVIRAQNRMSVRRITRQQTIFVRKDCIHKNYKLPQNFEICISVLRQQVIQAHPAFLLSETL